MNVQLKEWVKRVTKCKYNTKIDRKPFALIQRTGSYAILCLDSLCELTTNPFSTTYKTILVRKVNTSKQKDRCVLNRENNTMSKPSLYTNYATKLTVPMQCYLCQGVLVNLIRPYLIMLRKNTSQQCKISIF